MPSFGSSVAGCVDAGLGLYSSSLRLFHIRKFSFLSILGLQPWYYYYRPVSYDPVVQGNVLTRHRYNRTVPKLRELEQRLQVDRVVRHERFMVRDMSLQEILQGIVSLVVEFMDCDSCLVYLVDNDELVLCASNTPNTAAIGNVRLKLNEGLTGWVARERRLVAISREAYNDPRFKYFRDLPEDTFEAFLSAPVISRNRVVGVINVQHRLAHAHTGSEMELLNTVGEQVGCLLVLSRMQSEGDTTNHAGLVLASRPR